MSGTTKFLYSDIAYGVLKASDWYTLARIVKVPRSKAFSDPVDCWQNAVVDDTMTYPPGPKSLATAFVKVRIKDFQGPTLSLSTPSTGKKIRDYPHPCPSCGGWMLQLFTSTEHEGGSCPGRTKGKRL